MTQMLSLWRIALALPLLLWLSIDVWLPPDLAPNLDGQIALITGGSRGSGRGFAMGLSEAGATVYITGRHIAPLEEACALTPGPGKCVPMVVDSGDDKSLETLFDELSNRTGGRLDILVNNAYSAVGLWSKQKLLGKPFWEQGMELYDAVHHVGVRSHYKATLLALPMMQKVKRGLIVNTNSPGCLTYLINVPYGIAWAKPTAAMLSKEWASVRLIR